MAHEHRPPKTGPRGGTTTITPAGDVRKNLWLPYELSERLRQWAFKLRCSETELFRQGLERLLSELDAEESAADRGNGRRGS